MPSLSSTVDQRASFSSSSRPSTASSTPTAAPTAATAKTSVTATTTTTSTSTSTSPTTTATAAAAANASSSAASTSPKPLPLPLPTPSHWTRRPPLPTKPSSRNGRSSLSSVHSSSSTIAASNGCMILASSLPNEYAHSGEAMAARRSSFPPPSSPSPSSSSASANPAPNRITLRHTAVLNAQDDVLSLTSTASASITTNGAPREELQYQHRQQKQQQQHHHHHQKQSIVNGPRTDLSQQHLIEYREKLTRDLEQREFSTRLRHAGSLDNKARISPILEGAISTSSITTSASTTTSTESGNTVRGGITSVSIASTPSYPFPRMSMPPGSQSLPSHFHPSSSSSLFVRGSQPTPFEYRGILDKVLSEGSTPASTFTFNPVGTPQPEAMGFPNPNLSDLSLMLSAEPGLDAWWSTVVQIMRDIYKAERVTLAVPADTTDIENVPWGQKATYNEHVEDELSNAYLSRGSGPSESQESHATDNVSSVIDGGVKSSPVKRPVIPSRHSFTAYEENKEQQRGRTQEASAAALRRPSMLAKSKTQFPLVKHAAAELNSDHAQLSQDTWEQQHDLFDEEQDRHMPGWEAPFMASAGLKGTVLPILQALNYEADPLIDHTGVMRVLERGRTVALTRTYPYLATTNPAEQSSSSSSMSSSFHHHKSVPRPDSARKAKKQRSESMTKLSSIFSSPPGLRGSVRGKIHLNERIRNSVAVVDEDDPRPSSPKYEEYEQSPPSPWSQSPAPSPAVRSDTKENPFFTEAMVDEDSFNPDPTPADYSGMRPPEAIGVDNSWTVLHIPLTHRLFTMPHTSFKLNPTALHQKSHPRSHGPISRSGQPSDYDDYGSPSPNKDRSAPIAILSILSPVIPYPSNLRHSLDHLAPHLANSFSLCRHYTNIETELAGIKRRRPHTIGFGAITPFGRPTESGAFAAAEDAAFHHPPPAGSITSPSDYSALSKSAAGSPLGTPGWDSIALAQHVDRRQAVAAAAAVAAGSPAAISQSSGSYFSSKQARHQQQQQQQQQQSCGIVCSLKPRAGSKDCSTGEKRPFHLSHIKSMHGDMEADDSNDPSIGLTDEMASLMKLEGLEASVEGGSDDKGVDKPSDSSVVEQGQTKRGHTMLHSYGADFSSTFQSLPPSSFVSSKPTTAPFGGTATRRSGSFSSPKADMPPPSDRLKILILDSLPAHVFVALPQTGEIVWVNSRYLSYRGQSVADLSADPWGSIHPDDLEEYLQDWGRSLRTGEQFSRLVRIRRFDGAYRWFCARAVASKDKRGVIMQFLGSFMDVHDQRVAELKAARQEEVEASEAKHRLLANLIPQIIFTATEDEGITFANQQWLSYTGQSFTDALRLGFMDFVHPEDLAKCRIPLIRSPNQNWRRDSEHGNNGSSSGSGAPNIATTPTGNLGHDSGGRRGSSHRQDAAGGNASCDPSAATDFAELARKGILKEVMDCDGRPSYATEVRLRSKTGEYRWHLIRCVEIDTIDFGDGASSYFGSATDINDHKLLEAKLKEAMESKSRFLSNMSHEIRTPLIGISGMVSFLQDTTLNEEQRDYTNTIQTSANSLIMIINDILDLSKVDAGMMKLKFEWFHTRSLIEDVNELVSTMAIAKRLELNYLVDADVPAWVKGDKVRIRQVLLNVIGNAIKFTTEGEVFSRCRVSVNHGRTLEENEIMLEFSITDTGRGFTEEEKGLIFKPFSQIDGSSTRQHGGSGLGLVISRQLVELHGGRMEGTAVVGKGSTFTFTARFALPTSEDQPSIPGSPSLKAATPVQPTGAEGLPTHQSRSSSSSKQHQWKSRRSGKEPFGTDGASHSVADMETASPGVTSTGSSNQSDHSGRSHVTDMSSVASMNTGLTRFSEAAKASGQDLSQMRLAMPSGRESPERISSPDKQTPPPIEKFRPPMYSILVICPQYHSREATTQHIEMTLPKDVPHQITALGSVQEAEQFIGGDDPVRFTHIVINLPTAEAVIDVMDKITRSQKMDVTTILILSDSVQRQGVLKLANGTKYQRLLSDNLVTFIYKPVKPSRFAVIFDPDKVRDLSTDWNRSTAQQMVESQKASYMEIERRMGNKGIRVLLVEDNPVNQKVLTKYLTKIGVEVDIAVDGVECTETVLSKPHEYYALILCDLHMPRKDGYQACREIREWEQLGDSPKMPIIALSANVMSDVQEKCLAAGFSDYITKPVDFINLSRAMSRFF